MAEKLLKILYVFMAFVNVFLYGVSFILKLNMIPTQVDLSGLVQLKKEKCCRILQSIIRLVNNCFQLQLN